MNKSIQHLFFLGLLFSSTAVFSQIKEEKLILARQREPEVKRIEKKKTSIEAEKNYPPEEKSANPPTYDITNVPASSDFKTSLIQGEDISPKFDSEYQNNYFQLGMGNYGKILADGNISTKLENEMEEKDFLQFIKEKFNLKMIRHSNFNSKKIKRVGVLGGSGASGIRAAISQKCDAYLTGDIKYHDFFQSESKMLICDIGHFESEQFVTAQLFEILSEIFPKFAISKSVEKTNPVNYFL